MYLFIHVVVVLLLLFLSLRDTIIMVL